MSNKIPVADLEQLIQERSGNRAFRNRIEKMLEQGEERLVVVSPYKMAQSELDEIIKNLGLQGYENLEVENQVDSSMLMGLIIKFKNYYLDYSLRSRLNEISESFIV